jgi:flagellin-like hook-associated protein FlgL
VVANLSRYSILDQSGISALAQANTAQQTILTLLR